MSLIMKVYLLRILVIIFSFFSLFTYAYKEKCSLEQLFEHLKTGSNDFKKFINDHPDALAIYDELYKSGSKFVLTDALYLNKLSKVDPEVRKYIVAFTDEKKGSTLSKFLDECDNPGFRQSVNENPILAEAFVGHKNKWTKGDYEALADDIDLITTDPKVQDLISKWMNRSGKISNFDKVAKLGRSLGRKIVSDLINNKGGNIMKVLSKQTGISLEELAKYDVLSEVPLETVGGFMKADAVLIKRNALGKIEDTIIIENKLSSTTAFTVRQKEGFGAILKGQKEMKIKYSVEGLTEKDKVLQVSKNKIFKISDGGTDNISNVTVDAITKVN